MGLAKSIETANIAQPKSTDTEQKTRQAMHPPICQQNPLLISKPAPYHEEPAEPVEPAHFRTPAQLRIVAGDPLMCPQTRFSFSKPVHYDKEPAEPAEPAHLGKPDQPRTVVGEPLMCPPNPLLFLKTCTLSYKTRSTRSTRSLGQTRSTSDRCWGTAHVPTKPASLF